MTISPPLVPDDEDFNDLANEFAGQLSSAFGYSLSEAEEHIRDFYVWYDEISVPNQREQMRKEGFSGDGVYSAVDLFQHDGSEVVLRIGYTLAGGDTNTLEYLDWRRGCWDALRAGHRVPQPRFYEKALVERVRAMHAAKAQPAEIVAELVNSIPKDVAGHRVAVILKCAFDSLPYDVVGEVGALAKATERLPEERINQLLRPWFQ